MASNYPGALDTLATNKTDTTPMGFDHPQHHDDMADAINKIEAELGINPSGIFSTVAARLTNGALNLIGLKDYGAKGNGITVSDATTTNGSATVTSPTAAWTSADVGKLAVLRGAGTAGTPLVTTISTVVAAGQITLAITAGTSITGTASILYGSDDTVAVNAWITAFNVAGGGIAFASGTVGNNFLINPDAIAITQWTAKGEVWGIAPRVTIFNSISRTADCFSKATDHLYFRNLEIRCAPGTPTAGAGMRFASGQLGGLSNVRISSFWNTFECDSAYNWTIHDDCYFVDWKNFAAYVKDIASNDRGDQTIGGVFVTSVGGTGSAGIRYESGGGLKFGKLKITNGDYGLDLAVVDGASTSIALLAAVSFETQVVNNVRIGRAGTTGVFNDIHFSSFEFLIAAGKTNVQIGPGVSNMSFASGVMTGSGAGSIGIDAQSGSNIAIGGGVTFANMETPIKDNVAATRFKIDHDGIIYSNVTNDPLLVIKTANYTIDRTNRTILADATSGNFTVTLPTAANARGQQYIIKRISTNANNVTIATTSSQTIDASTTYVITNPRETVTVVSDGTNWQLI